MKGANYSGVNNWNRGASSYGVSIKLPSNTYGDVDWALSDSCFCSYDGPINPYTPGKINYNINVTVLF